MDRSQQRWYDDIKLRKIEKHYKRKERTSICRIKVLHQGQYFLKEISALAFWTSLLSQISISSLRLISLLDIYHFNCIFKIQFGSIVLISRSLFCCTLFSLCSGFVINLKNLGNRLMEKRNNEHCYKKDKFNSLLRASIYSE